MAAKAACKSIRHKKVQDRLGERQDAIVAADFVRRMGGESAGEHGFALGVLWAAEVQRSHG